MKRSKKPAVVEESEDVPAAELPRGRVVKRPDGFYWVSAKAGEENGPFASRADAEEHMLSGGDNAASEDPEALHEAESELGISEWIDPDSGEPAEDFVPRLEDH